MHPPCGHHLPTIGWSNPVANPMKTHEITLNPHEMTLNPMKSHINSIKPPQLQLHHSFRCFPQFFGQLRSKSRGRHQRLPVFARRGDAGATEVQEVQRPQR